MPQRERLIPRNAQASYLEAFVHDLIQRVSQGAQVEDGRVELKAKWPDPKKAARTLAGQANAWRGDPIVWVIGLDEQRGVIGATQTNPADWLAQVRSAFDEVEPDLLLDVAVVAEDGRSVVALLFDTSRSPYVVKSPSGESGITYEIPWRSGTGIRSAKRREVLRMLFQSTSGADAEVHAVRAYSNDKPGERPYIDIDLYLLPRTDERIVFPYHHGNLTCRPASAPDDFVVRLVGLSVSRTKSNTCVAGLNELTVTGPGLVCLTGVIDARNGSFADFKDDLLVVDGELVASLASMPPVSFRAVVEPDPSTTASSRHWTTVYEPRAATRD